MQARAHTAPKTKPNQPRATPRAAAPAAAAKLALRRARVPRAAPLDLSALSDLPRETLAAAGAAVAALLGGVAAVMAGQGPRAGGAGAPEGAAAAAAEVPAPLPRADAVLVLGATGRSGRAIVQELLRAGRTVVAAARSADKATEVFSGMGIQEGRQAEGSGIMFTAAGVDVTNPATLNAELFAGVTQVVSALGGVAGRLPDGSFGYLDGMTPEAVEAKGMANLVAAMKEHMAPQRRVVEEVLPMRTEQDLEAWERLDDVIMGGSSSSGIKAAEDGSGAVWAGDLITEGGGFCGARTRKLDLDLSRFDGLRMRVKSDGQTFKINVKTADQEDTPESTYQATFDTSEEGDWAAVHLPWSSFVSVKRAQSDPKGEPLTGDSISKLGLVLSRFEFNKKANPKYHAGPYTLAIAGGISAYRDPRPQLLVISSAGVERNALIGDDAEARKREIPIIQLNPGGVLNWKYEAECAARDSGFPYAVVRCTGLDDGSPASAEPRLLEADQGDAISGRVSRAEAAALVAAALASPDAADKTFELRRSEAADAAGKPMGPRQFTRLFLKLAPDAHRWRVGLQPFPKAVPPPAPPTEERTKEILADPRVQEVAARDRQQRMKAGVAPEGAAGGEGGAAEGAAEGAAAKEKELVTTSA
ncbi:MAG: complex I intermediate-associated protein 30-domain-containing protein [Monoraphidium minutum]|nr:MAG: complex I intermediate-associated protein 30-domain-containing protein [Monoraphidium minutum]